MSSRISALPSLLSGLYADLNEIIHQSFEYLVAKVGLLDGNGRNPLLGISRWEWHLSSLAAAGALTRR